MNGYVEALSKEIALRKDELANDVIKTIYFGGGTPSRLMSSHFNYIFKSIYAYYTVASDAEITIEANPDDLSTSYVDMLSELPFNRISIGIQSFDDNELKFLSRRHDANKAVESVKYCQAKGFDNISIDLMYGLPQQTMKIWKNNLEQACQLNIQHISAYHLIYEEKTKLFNLLQAGKVNPVDEDRSIEMFEMLIDILSQEGFDHYEVSNFAKEGLISQHNTSYWKSEKYMGLGPAAHSFDGKHRWWNVASLPKYMNGINNGEPEFEIEDLDLSTKYNEYVITGLRTKWGINLEELEKKFGKASYDYFLENAEKYFKLNHMSKSNNIVTLTHAGIFIADGIVSDLMVV